MSITDELREYVIDADGMGMTHGHAKCIYAIADHIDTAHRAALEKLAAQVDETNDMREFCGRIEQAATNRDDVQLWGVDYTPLPLDAGGVPIRVGDVVEWVDEPDVSRVVCSIQLAADGWWVYVGGTGRRPDKYRHRHEPTVEDVLRELSCVLMGKREFDGDVTDAIAEFAAKLRLAGEDE